MIDFKKITSKDLSKKEKDPIKLYDTLDRTSTTSELREEQKEILSKWYNEKYDDEQLIIKMGTGSGKSLVGLLMLQSLINHSSESCMYVCANKYLVRQLEDEAKKFGIDYCKIGKESNQIPLDFRNGKKILITHAHKVFNGKSIFGIGSQGIKVDTILLDDSHACIDTIKQASTITIENKGEKREKVYQKFIELFKDALIYQRESILHELKKKQTNLTVRIPYWVWHKKREAVMEILYEHHKDPCITFALELFKRDYNNYSCTISGAKIEISPYFTKSDAFYALSSAKRKITMTATHQEDIFLMQSMKFSKEAISSPLISEKINWTGEKAMIFPSIINPKCDRDLLTGKLGTEKIFRTFGTVILVNSTARAKLYEKQGCIILNKDNYDNELMKFDKGEVHRPFVINNMYDGIDLPDSMCRILIFDSKPYFVNLSDQYEEIMRPDSNIINRKMAQKIEQGLGRGVRGAKDYCLILSICPKLSEFLLDRNTSKNFSWETKEQIEIGDKIANEGANSNNNYDSEYQPVEDVMKQILYRDMDWKQFYSAEMKSKADKISEEGHNDEFEGIEIYEKENEIIDLLENREYGRAAQKMQEIVYMCGTSHEKAWYLQQKARFQFLNEETDYYKTQQAAFKRNHYLLRPEKTQYNVKINANNLKRNELLMKYIKQEGQKLREDVLKFLKLLKFGENSRAFENSLKEIGQFLGFESIMPDTENGRGPDNLWGSNNKFFLFECKNQVKKKREYINKDEVGQFHNHLNWFDTQYPNASQLTSFIIHPSNTLTYQASIDKGKKVRIITEEKLIKLTDQLEKLLDEICEISVENITERSTLDLINKYKFNYDDFVREYSLDYRLEKK